MRRTWKALATSALALGIGALPDAASAQCVGRCGTTGADGDVTAPPIAGVTTYGWVGTFGGTLMGGLPEVADESTNGSRFRSAPFSAAAGDQLEFYFNYVTSDGAGYADYAWARLLRGDGSPLATLFTARTTPNGNTVPGFAMPALDPDVTITPATVTITPNGGTAAGPIWSPIDARGDCFDVGCGFTGWVHSAYTVQTGGEFLLEFGVTNWSDDIWDSGFAFQGVQIAGTPVPSTPGATQDLPILPGDITPGNPGLGIPPVFVFDDAISGLWYDPPDTWGYEFVSTGPSLFTFATMPVGFVDPFDVYWWDDAGTTFTLLGSFAGNQQADFTGLLGGGATRFRIQGIQPRTDSTDPQAFPVQLSWTQPTGNSFTMTPMLVGVTAVPEPGTIVLLATGLAGVLAVRWRGRRTGAPPG